MNGRTDERPSNGAVDIVPRLEGASPLAASQTLVVDADYLAPSVPQSNYGKAGEIAKRVVARLIRFYTHEQDAVNETQRKEIEQLRARLAVLEAAVQQRFAVNERGLIRLQREHAESVTDFTRIAERMPIFESVRRTVSRMAPFRNEVRAHRRALMDVRQHFASLSARLTLVQREIAPTRKAVDLLRGEVAAAVAALRSELHGGHTTVRSDLATRHEEVLERAEAIFESVRREEAALSGAIAEHSARLASVVDDLARIGRAVDDQEPARRLASAESRLAEFTVVIEAFTGGIKRIADAEARMADIAGALNSLSDGIPDFAQQRLRDLAKRMDVLAADVANLRSRMLATPYVSTSLDAWIPTRLSTPEDFDYLGFEDVFRGPEQLVRERLRIYLPLLEGHVPIVELGAGRGEFLELLRAADLNATAVEINDEAVEHCRAKGLLNVARSDANAYLESLSEGTLGAIFSAQFAEHLSFTDLLRCLTLSRSRLASGGLFIAETVNPNSIEAAKTFFVDPSHVKPLFPEVFAFLCRSVGFSSVRLFYPSGGGFDEHDPTSRHEYAVVATV